MLYKACLYEAYKLNVSNHNEERNTARPNRHFLLNQVRITSVFFVRESNFVVTRDNISGIVTGKPVVTKTWAQFIFLRLDLSATLRF